jgi:hypothetical protein
MPKRTKEQLTKEIKMLADHITYSIGFAFEKDLDLQWIGIAKRRAQELAVECQRLEDRENEGIEEAVQQLRKGLEDE